MLGEKIILLLMLYPDVKWYENECVVRILYKPLSVEINLCHVKIAQFSYPMLLWY